MSYNKKILFVGHTGHLDAPFNDPSTRYRCFTLASALRRRGHTTAVVTQAHFEETEKLAHFFDYFYFHRPCLNEKLIQFLEKNKASKAIIADFDDLIFDVSKSSLMPAYRFRGMALSETATYLAKNAAACRYFSHFTMSTNPLVEKANEMFKPKKILVSSNALEPGYVSRAKRIRANMQGVKRPYKLGYFSGTATHDADLASISSSIIKMFEKYQDGRMLILGPASIPLSLLNYKNRIDHRMELVPFSQLPYVMAQVETVIAPLEWNDFTICKSGLKFFEAALVGCSVAATPIPDIDRFNSAMLRKCETQDDWNFALTEPFQLTPESIEQEITNILKLVDSEIIAEKWETEFLS